MKKEELIKILYERYFYFLDQAQRYEADSRYSASKLAQQSAEEIKEKIDLLEQEE